MQRMKKNGKERKRTQRIQRSFIKNRKERKNIALCWKERMPNPAVILTIEPHCYSFCWTTLLNILLNLLLSFLLNCTVILSVEPPCWMQNLMQNWTGFWNSVYALSIHWIQLSAVFFSRHSVLYSFF